MPIHVLGQTDNKYMVVLSNETDGKVLLNKMNRELGTLWTIMNQPYYVKWSYLDKDEWDIEDTVLKTMVKYGVENVRGGSYQTRILSENDKTIVDRHIREIKTKYAVPIQKVVRGHFVRRLQKECH